MMMAIKQIMYLESDIILIGVSRTSKTPTSIYLANKGLKTANIPLVNEMKIPKGVHRIKKFVCNRFSNRGRKII